MSESEQSDPVPYSVDWGLTPLGYVPALPSREYEPERENGTDEAPRYSRLEVPIRDGPFGSGTSGSSSSASEMIAAGASDEVF